MDPLVWLSVTAVIPMMTFAGEFGASGRRASASIVAAFLGLPGNYEVSRPAFLWIARLLVVGVIAFVVVVTRRNRPKAPLEVEAPDPTADR